jgi:membrane protease YdiL (CAAX protease family)
MPYASRQVFLVALCLCAGVAPLAARWIPDDAARVAYGLLVAAAYLTFALFARRSTASLAQFWQMAYAFFVLAVVQVLNNAVPGFVATRLMHDQPTGGNPFASTVSGTVVLQLLEALLAIVPIVVLVALVGSNLASIYMRKRVDWRWLVFALGIFAGCYAVIATSPVRPDSFLARLLPTNGTLSVDRIVALTPALLVMVVSNGFEEELLFRGLFLRQYERFLGARIANVLQAIVFSAAHVGVGYTPVALFFLVAVVFPLGLVAGFLMRASNGVIVPAIVHAGLDMPIYLVFLSYVT